MKILFKKLGKVHIVKRIFYFLTNILYLASLIFFIYKLSSWGEIIKQEKLIVGIGLAILIIWFLIYLLSGLLSMLAKKTKTFIFLTIFTLILVPAQIGASFLLNFGYETMDFTQQEKEYSTVLVTHKGNKKNFNSDSVIGMIANTEDIEGNILAKKLIKKNNLTNKVDNSYATYEELIIAFYKKEVDAIFVTANYATTFDGQKFESDEDEEETPFSERVEIIYTHSEEMENQDNELLISSKEKSLTEPFTVLIMGVDSAKDGLKANQAFNGDTLILVTFNPNTLTATMFSIPRDMYVPIACNHNRYNKINSSAAYGSSCVIKTVQQLTGIEIDYYVKMNFKGVVQLVDALGGVTVDVEEPDFYYDKEHKGQVCEQNSLRQFGNNLVCMDTGIQTLNGEQALAYARCRHLYAISDIARNQHQQQLIEAVAQKLKTIRSVEDFQKILDAVSNNIETNITPEQIMSFYNVGKDMLLSSNKNSTALSIKKTYLAYYNLPIYIPASGRYTSALGYYPGSLEAIKNLMKENLGISKPTPITDFSISYNEDYTTPLTGYGITTGGKLERMPNLIGQTKTYVENWCTERSINCTFSEVTSTVAAGQITTQSQHEGVLLKPIKSITFEYSNGLGVITPPPSTEEETPGETPEGETPGNNENTGENNTEQTPTTPTTPEVTPTA